MPGRTSKPVTLPFQPNPIDTWIGEADEAAGTRPIFRLFRSEHVRYCGLCPRHLCNAARGRQSGQSLCWVIAPADVEPGSAPSFRRPDGWGGFGDGG
jgi:hypothetical protein